MEDRCALVPKHTGYNVLPNLPLFGRLLRYAGRSPARIAIHDVRSNATRTHLELLSDVLLLRETLLNTLDTTTREALERRDEVYIAVVAAGGYEYTVALLAVLALGAAAVPITPALPVAEMVYFVTKSRAALVLASSLDVTKCSDLQKRITSTSNQHFQSVSIGPCTFAPMLNPADILISSDKPLEEDAPGIVIFTSGTTGPPKGAVMRRSFFFDTALSVADHYRLTEDDVILHVLPVHHATGVGISFFPFLLSGSRIEFRSGSFDEAWMWERLREGTTDLSKRISFFSGVPTIYMRMKKHYQRVLSKLPPRELATYTAGARALRVCMCGTSALPDPLDDFWTTLLQKRITQRYGATEFGAVFKVKLDDKSLPHGSVGQCTSGVDVKLSEGDEGEVLVKSPHMFLKYLGDPKATREAHNGDGYFRTGDIARREGEYYFIQGRISQDILKSGGYKISALDIERELLSLPFITEAMVVGVPDEEFGQRVAALITLQTEELNDAFRAIHGNWQYVLTIDNLRRDLKGKLAGYKQPTLLRILDGELPKTATGKVQKKMLGPKFFPVDCEPDPEVQRWVKSREKLAKL